MKDIKQKINQEINKDCCQHQHRHHHSGHQSGGGAIYGLGVVGALFYFLQNTVTLGAVLVGIAKAVFWPAFVVFRLLTLMQI